MHLLEHIFQTSLLPFILRSLSPDLYKVLIHKTCVSFAVEYIYFVTHSMMS